MTGIIERRCKLQSVFKGYGAHEVYAIEGFTLADTNPKIVVLMNLAGSLAELHMGICAAYDYDANVYLTRNPMDPLLKDMKIIWRDGKWYL